MTFTDAQLLDLEIPQRFDSVRFDVLDQGLAVIGELQPSSDSPVSVTVDVGARVRRTARGMSLPPGQLGDVDLYADRVRPVIVLQNGSEYHAGVFLFADAPEAVRSFGSTLDCTLGDQDVIAGQPLLHSVSYPRGTVVSEAIEDYATSVLALPSVSVEPSLQVLNRPLTWTLGTGGREPLEEMAKLIGYLPPYFDRSGTLVARPTPDYPAADPGALAYASGTRIVDETLRRGQSLLSAYNIWVVISSSVNGGAAKGQVKVSPLAPHSFENRGYYVPRIERIQGISDPFWLNVVALSFAFTDLESAEWAQFATTLDPRHDMWDVVSLDGDNYREVGWTAELRPGGRMSHDLRRAYTVE